MSRIDKPEYLQISGEAWLAQEITRTVSTMAKHKKGKPLVRKLKIFELLKAYNNPNNQRPGRELLVELSGEIPDLLQLDLDLPIPSPEEKEVLKFVKKWLASHILEYEASLVDKATKTVLSIQSKL